MRTATIESTEGAAPARTGRLRLAALAGLVVLSEALYVALVRLDATNGAGPVLRFLAVMGVLFAAYAAACTLVRRIDPRWAVPVIALGAVAFRLTLVPAGLPPGATASEMVERLHADASGTAVSFERFQLYDDDIWRYLWDGHVWAEGVNPYRYAPTDPALDRLAPQDGAPVWADIRENINYASTPTIYPPGAQIVFRFAHAVAPGSVVAMKALLVAFDLLAALFVALTLRRLGRSPADAALYAWNPLVVKVFAGSGHVDALLVAALAALVYFVVRRAPVAVGAVFGVAVLAKLSPLVLAPLVVRRVGLRGSVAALAVVAAGYAPLADAGSALFAGLAAFARVWQFNAGAYSLVEWLVGPLTADPGGLARAVCAAAIVGAIATIAVRDDGSARGFAPRAALATGALLLASPTLMPWYVAWVLPLAIVARQRVWLWLSALVCLAFLVMIDETERPIVLWLEYGAFAAIALVELRRRWRVRANRRDTTTVPATALPSDARALAGSRKVWEILP